MVSSFSFVVEDDVGFDDSGFGLAVEGGDGFNVVCGGGGGLVVCGGGEADV